MNHDLKSIGAWVCKSDMLYDTEEASGGSPSILEPASAAQSAIIHPNIDPPILVMRRRAPPLERYLQQNPKEDPYLGRYQA